MPVSIVPMFIAILYFCFATIACYDHKYDTVVVQGLAMIYFLFLSVIMELHFGFKRLKK